MAETKHRIFCSVPRCFCSSRKHSYLSFHLFPKESLLKAKWLKAIRREEGLGFKVQRGSTYVCSRHFAQGDYTKTGRSRLKPGVVPSLFPWNNFVASQKGKGTYETRTKRLAAKETISAAQESVCSSFSGRLKATTTAVQLDHDYVLRLYASALDAEMDSVEDLEANSRLLPSASLLSRFCASNDQIRFYTKFPSEEVLKVFWESVAPAASRLVCWTKAKRIAEEACLDPSPPCNIPLIDEFFMYCMCVAVGIKEKLIANMFNVSIATVSRVIITWANYLFIILSSLPIWISRNNVKSSMPLQLRKHCFGVRVILGCTEIAVEKASSLMVQSGTFSDDENSTTLKGLIGVAPCGLITFISSLYTSSISNNEITRISGILPLLELGDDIMADKDFLIQDLLDDVGARLIKSSLIHGDQFPKEETEQTQAIARLRTTVETVIARVKSFHIWDSPVSLTLIGSVNQIWHNCCVMANYQEPLCFEE